MQIYVGNFEDAVNSPRSEWKTYPYARASQKESFSQVIFRWLGMPEVAGEAEGKITLHQVLRLLYADQMTPVDNIFRFEQRDSPLVRQTVGDLLCGAYDSDMYTAQIQIKEVERQYENATNELKSIYTVIGPTDQGLTMKWVDALKSKVTQELKQVLQEIEKLEERIFHGEVSDGLSLDEQKSAYQELVNWQTQLAATQAEKDAIEYELADSQNYIKSQEAKLSDLNDSSITADVMHGITFMYCPSCLAPISKEVSSHACCLCKSPYNEENAKARILGLINDISEQIKQSKRLQQARTTQLEKLDKSLVGLKANWEAAQNRYKLANRTPSTELRTKSKELHRKAGSLEQKLANLSEKEVLISRIEELSKTKAALQAKKNILADFIERKKHEQETNLFKAYTVISDNTCNILRQDLARQNTFSDAHTVNFSFGDNRLSVNGESFFSASSMVFFKNSFMLSMLKSALEHAYFRHPRFLIMDTIEDKGMEPERSHNFQRIMKVISDESKTTHQLIYATSMIAPELKDSKHVVGRFYTHEKRTLQIPV